ncbi:5-formyltetrahydrofolate cyclo-ligase [Nonlabens antarcticus]|uniref:5-formyltetrahydrofolate cyclo-ligase n=1 Tax=Nonlabens antarcticus TaxID=392714 RepID=UPI001891C266|nr:5-formyltetrahydrofolate cyclo-ligase [Nonlabens antarcticus]
MKSKVNLRKEYLAKRADLSEEDIHELSVCIANNTLKLDIWDQKLFHLFLSIDIKNEIRTEYILQILQGRDKNVALSRSDFKTSELRHFLLTDQTVIKINEYGIPEPQENEFEIDAKDMDVVFIPLLAADSSGNRVGYGKGFYDRFLSKCRSNTIKIGLSFFEPLDFEIATESTDIPLNQLVTPKGIVRFK